MPHDHMGGRRVLVVDDEPAARSLESFALEGTGRYWAVEAANSSDALGHLQNEQFDCAVIDLDMPDMSGTELIGRIRAHLDEHQLPIVLVLPPDARADDPDVATSRANHVIAKPFDPWDLARLLDSLTGALQNPRDVLSVDAVLRGFPYPTMVLDAKHRVLLANGSFYRETSTGIGECYVFCMERLHEGGEIPVKCPLEQCVRTGEAAYQLVETVLGRLRVSVYPLAIHSPDGEQLFLHVTQPVES